MVCRPRRPVAVAAGRPEGRGPAAGGRSLAADPAAGLSAGYRRYALWVLLVIYILNFLDRQIVTILAEPIKQELDLKDWQLGMMTGLAFAIFYTVLGIPIARHAERFASNPRMAMPLATLRRMDPAKLAAMRATAAAHLDSVAPLG